MIDPPTRERGGRTTEQHFVPQPDAPVDLRVQVVAWQHLVFIEPAANTLALEPVMQGVGEDRICMVVTNNRLRVFRIANTVRLGRGVSQERW